jgi:eukaryotic-like serine/threonine-protein kinase
VSEADSASPVKEGEVIAGKFRVERVLGVGGMGVVVAAMHLELEERVALKFLLPEAASRPEVAARFAREARSAAKIQSEHVARVRDVGTLPDGSPYMVMEFMNGEDLEQVLARVGPLPVAVATDYVLQASEAIAEAHALGIVHRDLKPANLFLASRASGDPVIKVLDFGISKSTQSTEKAQLTKTSAIMGSPLYMSPEQMTSSKNVDTRSDVWALGAVLYELLTHKTPFTAETMPELVAAILQAEHAPISALRPDVPPELDAAIHRCLAKRPQDRFANVAEFASAIAPFGQQQSGLSVTRITHILGVSQVPQLAPAAAVSRSPTVQPAQNPQAGTNSQLAQSLSSPSASAPPPKGRSAWVVALPVFAVLAIGGAVATYVVMNTKTPKHPGHSAHNATAAATGTAAPTSTASASPGPTSSPPAATGDAGGAAASSGPDNKSSTTPATGLRGNSGGCQMKYVDGKLKQVCK